MNIVELKKENLLAFLSDKENYCGHGTYGILMNYDENTLIKIYYKDIFITYTTLDGKVLDEENNILINPNNLDIKLIDLDGTETRIETKNYIKNYPHIKDNCINGFNKMSIRLSKY